MILSVSKAPPQQARLVRAVGAVCIYDVLDSADQQRIDALLKIYADLFPQYAHYTARMQQRVYKPAENAAGHVVHYWLVEVNQQAAGIRTFRYIPSRRCGIAHALAVYPEFRHKMVNGMRLSHFIIVSCLEQIIEDAKQRGLPAPCGMVNEVDYPNLMKHYEMMGIHRLNIDYKEPIFSKNGTHEIEFHPMFLGLLPNPEANCDFADKSVISNFALAYLVDHYGLNEDNQDVQKILQSVNDLHGDEQ